MRGLKANVELQRRVAKLEADLGVETEANTNLRLQLEVERKTSFDTARLLGEAIDKLKSLEAKIGSVEELEQVLWMVGPCHRVPDVLENKTAFCLEYYESVETTGRCDQPWSIPSRPDLGVMGGKQECLMCAARAVLEKP